MKEESGKAGLKLNIKKLRSCSGSSILPSSQDRKCQHVYSYTDLSGSKICAFSPVTKIIICFLG